MSELQNACNVKYETRGNKMYKISLIIVIAIFFLYNQNINQWRTLVSSVVLKLSPENKGIYIMCTPQNATVSERSHTH